MPEQVNPKEVEALALGKQQLDLLEPAANDMTAAALANGKVRHGQRNYVLSPIKYRLYLAAMERHIDAIKRGEDTAPDSGVHHLGHIAACVHVLAAAMEAGTFVDDRGPFPTKVEDEPEEHTDTIDIEPQQSGWSEIGGYVDRKLPEATPLVTPDGTINVPPSAMKTIWVAPSLREAAVQITHNARHPFVLDDSGDVGGAMRYLNSID